MRSARSSRSDICLFRLLLPRSFLDFSLVLSQTFTFHYTYITKKGNNRQNINNFLPRVNFSIQMDNLEIPEMDQTNQPVEIVEEFVKIDFESPSNSKLPEILITVLVAAILLGGIGYFVFTILKKKGIVKSNDGMEKVPTEEDGETEETKAEIV